jgi:hypothetical protein
MPEAISYVVSISISSTINNPGDTRRGHVGYGFGGSDASDEGMVRTWQQRREHA